MNRAMLLLTLLLSMTIICHSAVIPAFLFTETNTQNSNESCDLFEEATTLHCIAPLVEYADLSRSVLHPPLSGIDRLCNQYSKYLVCTAGVRNECRESRAVHIEKMYEMICEEKYLSIVREEKECLLELERDSSLKQCFVNRTNTLRDEHFKLGAMASPSASSYECDVIQAYVDCLLEREGNSICNDAVKVEVSLLSLLATRDGSSCQLNVNGTRSRPGPPLEECDNKGNCICRLDGYYYDRSEGRCIDIDECAAYTSGCSQKCSNLPGSFECSCDEQYYLILKDNKTCVRKDKDPLWLFFAHGQSIWNISVDGKSFQLQRAGLQKTAMIDIDVKERRLYYADIGANAIERMNIEGTFPQAVQQNEVDGLEGIAVDWIGRNLYTVRRSDILVQTLDGRYRRAVYKDVLKTPRAIVVHPNKGIMFVSDWSTSSSFIASAAMDGSSFRTIINDRIQWPNALTIDQYADKLYWADAFLDTIEVCNFDGSGRRTVISDAGSVPHVFGLTIADDFLYWTDWTYRGLLRANKINGDNITVLAQTALLPYSLKVFHKTIQPVPEINPCTPLGCSHLCLLNPSGRARCECVEGFMLAEDGKTCISNCSQNQVVCGGVDPKCISKLYWCDGTPHCVNRADEKDCRINTACYGDLSNGSLTSSIISIMDLNINTLEQRFFSQPSILNSSQSIRSFSYLPNRSIEFFSNSETRILHNSPNFVDLSPPKTELSPKTSWLSPVTDSCFNQISFILFVFHSTFPSLTCFSARLLYNIVNELLRMDYSEIFWSHYD